MMGERSIRFDDPDGTHDALIGTEPQQIGACCQVFHIDGCFSTADTVRTDVLSVQAEQFIVQSLVLVGVHQQAHGSPRGIGCDVQLKVDTEHIVHTDIDDDIRLLDTYGQTTVRTRQGILDDLPDGPADRSGSFGVAACTD